MELQPIKHSLMQHTIIVSFMSFRLTAACQKKCISPKYKEGELTKRRVLCTWTDVWQKYLEIHERIGKKLTAMSAQDEQLMAQMQSR